MIYALIINQLVIIVGIANAFMIIDFNRPEVEK
jgi:hypothetical protein